MRDPELLGIALTDDLLRAAAARHAGMETAPLSVVFDYAERRGMLNVPNYDGAPTDHAALRAAELRGRAQEGDKFAAALLRGETLAEEPVD